MRNGTTLLREATETPRLEAEVLLAHVTGLTRAALLAHPERPLRLEETIRYRTLLDRRAEGYPLPYLTGRVEFYGLELTVTPDVLIPRPETELLVDLALDRKPRRAIDVGTGSGCIAVALAVSLPSVRVIASDVSRAALLVADENARRHRVRDRVHLVQCDLICALAAEVDLVVANLPYVAHSEWASLPLSVRQYEPRLALDGGSDGLRAIERLLRAAPRFVRPGGAILVEIGSGQGRAVLELARSVMRSTKVRVRRDLAGRDRVLEVEV